MGRTERNVIGGVAQAVTVEDSMSVVHASNGRLRPASEHLLSEVQIVSRLAKATLAPSAARADWDRFASDHDTIHDAISRVVPGFEDFNRKAAVPGGFTLPHAPRARRVFDTATGTANLTVPPLTSASRRDSAWLPTTRPSVVVRRTRRPTCWSASATSARPAPRAYKSIAVRLVPSPD